MEEQFKSWSNKFYHIDEEGRRVLISPTMFGSKTFYFVMVANKKLEKVEYAMELDSKTNAVRTFEMEKVDEEIHKWFLDIYEHSKKTLLGSLQLTVVMRERAKKTKDGK